MVYRLYKEKLNMFLLAAVAAWGVGCGEKSDPSPAPPPPAPPVETGPSQVAFWLTNPDRSAQFQKQNLALNFKASTTTNNNLTLEIDTTQTYQAIDGFGYTITTGSAYVLNQMSAASRADLLRELFSNGNADNTIGVSYLRLNLGASDLSPTVYSYQDVMGAAFSLAPDQAYYIPILKQILAINPNIKLMASPWSPPAWMKTNNSPIGGSLRPEYYNEYAGYLVQYIQDMKGQGITIDALTIQNEPLHGGNNPSMVMQAEEQKNFVKNNLGPAFRAANLNTKIVLYDHNLDRPDYPISIMNDPEAKQYVDGSAFHLYGGTINRMSEVHNAHPDKNLYFTEQWVGANDGDFASNLKWHIANVIIGSMRNWSKNALEWNLAADANNRPFTDGGCNTCLPAVTVAGNNATRNVAYYIIAHASKFVRPNSVRVKTTLKNAQNIEVFSTLQHVGFQTSTGKKVVLVLNDTNGDQTFNIRYRGQIITSTLKGGAVGTYVW
ncbi:glycoside hydrolase family 30 protein [Rufibacter quisquiliarum]|uniref:Glucosylceramidase n=1 Tax=Rufibacter quisquiliarum TaxID=1549639 RepID=A0A839GF60_9BACT|nr:glycoside hydrolase family 30 beta sandwich domain-containing protein [Rufibacter quisquiliarum]MBA9077542.1 glucosylceramidase [Rufibacter quisquiliarum]